MLKLKWVGASDRDAAGGRHLTLASAVMRPISAEQAADREMSLRCGYGSDVRHLRPSACAPLLAPLCLRPLCLRPLCPLLTAHCSPLTALNSPLTTLCSPLSCCSQEQGREFEAEHTWCRLAVAVGGLGWQEQLEAGKCSV